jgi:hypothetical protein
LDKCIWRQILVQNIFDGQINIFWCISWLELGVLVE